ncbi:MAG: hypothetical protein ACKVWV_16410 [Planctomycetota bacterium]
MTASFASAAAAIDRAFGAGTAAAHGGRFERSARGTWICTLAFEQRTRWCEVEDDRARELALADEALLPAAPWIARAVHDGAAQVLAWRPGRRVVARVSGAHGPHIVKGFRPGRASAAARRHALATRAFAAAGFRVPALLEEQGELELLRFEFVSGRTYDPLGDHVQTRHVGVRLAALQRAGRAAEGTVHGRADELAALVRRGEEWRTHVGPLPENWSATLERLALVVFEGALVCAHRDLHDGQLLVADAGLALLDFDMFGSADAALDVGNLVAHLHLSALVRARRDAAAAAEASLAAGLRAGGAQLSTRALAFYQSTSALRLALVYGMRPRWTALSEPLVALAEHWAQEAER